MQPTQIAKAELVALKPDGTDKPNSKLKVQFNPETLKVSYANQIVPPKTEGAASGNAPANNATTATQFIGSNSTKFGVQLWFDVTGENAGNESDVRKLTEKVVNLIRPTESASNAGVQQKVPPGASFRWGTFKFDGIVESVEESLEFFSPEGKPLRASVSLSMSQQSIEFQFNAAGGNAGAGRGRSSGVGTRPLASAPAGATLQGMAAAQGQADNWKAIATANGIENPRQLQPGQLIDMNARSSTASAPRLSVGGL